MLEPGETNYPHEIICLPQMEWSRLNLKGDWEKPREEKMGKKREREKYADCFPCVAGVIGSAPAARMRVEGEER